MSRMREIVRLQKDVLYDWTPRSVRFGDLLRRTTHYGWVQHYAMAISSSVCVEFGPVGESRNLFRLLWGVPGEFKIRDTTHEDVRVDDYEEVDRDSYRTIGAHLMAAFPAFHKTDDEYFCYTLLGNNCEHQARAVVTRQAICTQVPRWWGQRNADVESRLFDFAGRTIVSANSVRNYTK